MYEVFKPKSAFLSKYISEITVLKEDSSYPKKYFAFPHTVSSIAFFKDTEINYSNHYLEINNTQNESFPIVAIGKYIAPLLVRYNEYVEEIAVNFTPTGINYFFDGNFGDIINSQIQILNYTQLKAFSILLFGMNEEERILEIEHFFEQRFVDKNLQLIETIISLVENDKSVKFKDIAETYTISVRHLNRLFHKYIGCSPKDYKKIIRFRDAIKDYNKKNLNLTEICLKNEFYDSPHFTKEFRSLTNKNPKDYFQNLTFASKNQFPYIFK